MNRKNYNNNNEEEHFNTTIVRIDIKAFKCQRCGEYTELRADIFIPTEMSGAPSQWAVIYPDCHAMFKSIPHLQGNMVG
jgi:hypothetical protein